MSETVSETQTGPFDGRIMLFVVGAAILSFMGYLFLSAYAPEMKMGLDGRGHARSNSAIGYSAIVALREGLGRSPNLMRSDSDLETNRLVVVTPELSTDPVALAKFVKDRGDRPTLIILPKRAVQANPLHKGWVHGRDIVPKSAVAPLLAKIAVLDVDQHRASGDEAFTSDWAPGVAFAKGAVVQTIASEDLEPYITDSEGRILLAGVRPKNAEKGDDYTPVYILADPDVMNNLGVGNPQMAYAASGILDGLSTDDSKEVEFDLTLNGLGRSKGLLKLAFEPPFLTLTICLFVAALMALANGLMRFGPPMREQAAIAPGKGALIANTAGLLRLAKLEHKIGPRYLAVIVDNTAHALGMHGQPTLDAVRDRFDRMTRVGVPFSNLAQAATDANTSDEMLVAAQALYKWRKEVTG